MAPLQKALVAALLAASVLAAAAFQFEVGDEMRWAKPTGKERETYNEWAAQNRFHIRDTLHFSYAAKDSVVVVSSADYLTCNASNPIAKFDDGSTVFELNRPGFFYIISGQPGHCKSGQRLIVRVMHPLQAAAPEPAPELPPSPAPSDESGGDSGWPELSSAAELCVASYLVAAFVGLVVTFM